MSKFTSNFYFNMSGRDIRYIDLTTHEPVETKLTLTSNRFMDRIYESKYYSIYSKSDKNDTTEHLKCIPFSYHFYQMVARNGVQPTPEEYADTYIHAYLQYSNAEHTICEFKPELKQYSTAKRFIIQPLRNRILRAYTAYVRELDTYLYLLDKLSDRGYRISYDYELDAYHGIDILVERNDFRIGIASCIQTDQSNQWLSQKQHDQSLKILPFLGIFNGPDATIDQTYDLYLYTDKAKRKLTKLIGRQFKDHMNPTNKSPDKRNILL